MFQSETPHLWIDAAFNLKGWLETDRDWSYFEVGSTEGGSIHAEGEEEESNDDDEEIPQDRILRRDGEEDREPDERDSRTRPSSWDYDESTVS